MLNHQLLLVIILIISMGCNPKEAAIVDANSIGPNEEVPEVIPANKRIFKQEFELENGEIIKFQNCDDHDVPCTIELSFISDDGDDSNDVYCRGTGVSHIDEENDVNILSVSNMSGNNDLCYELNNTYQYEVVSCQFYNQETYPCGTDQNPYDLIFSEL